MECIKLAQWKGLIVSFHENGDKRLDLIKVWKFLDS